MIIGGDKFECDVSHYCPVGFEEPRSCLFASTNCASKGLAKQDEAITLILCIVILVACIIIIKAVADFIYNIQHVARKDDFENIEHHQALYLQTKQELASHISAKVNTKIDSVKDGHDEDEDHHISSKLSILGMNVDIHVLSSEVLENISNLIHHHHHGKFYSFELI